MTEAVQRPATKAAPKMKDGLVKRGTTWSYVVREQHPETGKTRPRWVGGFRTREDAKRARDKARAATHDGTYVAPRDVTVGQWLRVWLDSHAATLKPSTLHSYQAKADRYLVPNLGGTKLQALSPSRLSKLWADLAERGGKDGGPLSPRSVEYTRAILRKACSDAIVERLLTVNPVHGSKAPRRQSPELLVWDDQQQVAFLDATKTDRWGTLWRLALATGIRRGELCGLRWDEVDLEAARLRVSVSATQIGGEVVTTDTKTHETRCVDLDPVTVAALRELRKRQAAERLAFGPGYTDNGLVFVWPDGSRVLPDYLSKEFMKAQARVLAARADTLAEDIRRAHPGVAEAEVSGRADRQLDESGTRLPRLTLHGCRHSHACTLLRAGLPVHVVAARLGHRDPSVTLRVYAHAIPSDGAGAAAAVARALGGV